MSPKDQHRGRSLRVFLLGAGFENENMGVRALAAGAVKSFLHQFPDAQLSLLDYAKEPGTYTVFTGQKQAQIPLLNIRFSKRLFLSNNIAILILISVVAKLLPSRRVRHWMLSKNAVLRKLLDADLFLSVAGGDSFSDIYGLTRLMYVSLPQILAFAIDIPLVLLPQTVGPFKTRVGKWVAGLILRRASTVYCRDYTSMQLADSLAGRISGRRPAQFCYDMAFVLDPVRANNIEISGLRERSLRRNALVGVNVSGLLSMGGYTKSNMFGLKTGYVGLIQRVIDHLITRESADVILVPHVYGKDPDSESDIAACQRLYHQLKPNYGDRIGVLATYHDQSEIKAIIGSCDFFIGARMHACIAALSQSVPAVAIAYSDKFKGVLQTVGVDRLVLDPRELSEAEIVSAISDAYRHRETTRAELAKRLPQVQSTVLNLFAFLQPTLSASILPVQEDALPVST